MKIGMQKTSPDVQRAGDITRVDRGGHRPDLTLFIPDLTGGGAERVMVNLAKGISERGYKVDLLLVNALGPYLAQVPSQVRIVELEANRTGLSIFGLARYARSSKTPVIVSALHHANLALLFAKRLFRLNTRVIPTIHNTLSSERENMRTVKSRIQHALIGTCYGWADVIVAVSNEAAADLIDNTGIDRDKVRTIYNPVITSDIWDRARESVDHPWFSSDATPLVLAIGRLTEQKDFPTLIHAFKRVVQNRSARLMILGEGEERLALERLAAKLELGELVAFPGFVQNPYAYLDRANVFVLSSKWEGLPTVLIEGLALGVPLVATNCKSGPREILAGGKYGELVPVGDSKALAEAIVRALDTRSHTTNNEAWTPYTEEASIEAYLRMAGVGEHA